MKLRPLRLLRRWILERRRAHSLPHIALLAIMVAGFDPGTAAAQGIAGDAGCVLCHGELELLRRHSTSLAEARALLVSDATLRASAHDSLSCASCHSGFERYPHDRGAPAATAECTSCHEPETEQWSHGVHAARVVNASGGPRPVAATCADCHGVHDVVVSDSASREARERLNVACVACHASSALTATDPHADTVTCAACHSAHGTRRVNEPGSQVAPHEQVRTCGQCHSEVADSFPLDAHGRALAALDPTRSTLRMFGDSVPTCSSCHGAHGMRAPSHEAFESQMVDACGVCHAKYSDTYFWTYHGKATALGSEIVATCHACHGAHAILPADSARSMVSSDRVLDTCQACHEHADARFVQYDSHPDPWDRERNPPLFFSFIFMNALLFGVLGVFTLHTALWWLRLWLDERKGRGHGHREGSS